MSSYFGVQKHKYNIRCPECPGFVNKEYICETCDIKICKHCQDIIPKDIKLLKSAQQTDETNEQTDTLHAHCDLDCCCHRT